MINIWRMLWTAVWNISERTGVGIGRFAPWVFHQMIGCDHDCKKVD